MSMVIAFSWKEKIIVMADSRISRQTGNKSEKYDNRFKIFPVNGQLVITHTGVAKIPYNNGKNYLDVSDVIKHFIKINREQFTDDGGIVLKGLIKCWSETLLQIGLKPNTIDMGFLLCEWSNKITPRIYSYSSETKNITEGSLAIGDKEALLVISQYTRKNLENMTFEEVICHFKKGFSEVMQRVKTVGGDIHIYELNQNPKLSKWINSPSISK